MPRLADLNRQKRDYAYSGKANIGDVPWLYALQAEQAAANQPAGIGEQGGGPADAAAPNPTGGGAIGGGAGGGGTTGGADTGMPGPGQTGLGQEVDNLYNMWESGQAGEPGGVGDNYSENPYADPAGFGTVGSIGGLLTGIPGLGMIGAGIGAAYDYELANQFDPAYSGSFGRFLSSLGNYATGGLFGGSQLDEAIGGYQDATGTGLNEAALKAGVTGGAYSGPKGVVGPQGGGAAESGYGREALDNPATPGGDLARGVVDRARRDRGGQAGEGGGRGGGGGFGCFVAGTQIKMADGSTKAIEDIREGDMVAAFDGLGPLQPRRVATLMHYRERTPLSLTVAGSTLRVTSEHPFLVPSGEYTKAGDLVLGGFVVTASGETAEILAVEPGADLEDVFNFEVEGLHTYVAGGLRVHNIKHQGGVISEDRVPGQVRGDVAETLQEGEGVLTADAVEVLGPGFVHGINMMARMMRR